MSLARKKGTARYEYDSYLKSASWAARKGRFYQRIKDSGKVPACEVCGLLEKNKLDLHHMSYEGVSRNARGVWMAAEKDEDLVILCREHHSRLHYLFDTRGRDLRGQSRAWASAYLIVLMKRNFERGRR